MKKIIALLLVLSTLTSCAEHDVAVEYYENTNSQVEEVQEETDSFSVEKNDISEEYSDISEDFGDSDFDDMYDEEETTAATTVTSTSTTVQTTITTVSSTVTTTTTTTRTIPEYIYYLNVPYYSQQDYPTGCEIVCMSMLLGFYGFDISASELIEQGYIETCPLTEDENGVIHSGDPNKVFIGNPYEKDGYGCYAGAVYAALDRYLDQEYYDAANVTGMTLSELCQNYIDCGSPVIVWESINMKDTRLSEKKWVIDETGEEFTWLSNEHCMVLVGYDESNYYLHDPIAGEAIVYEKNIAEKRFSELGRQAVVISPW